MILHKFVVKMPLLVKVGVFLLKIYKCMYIVCKIFCRYVNSLYICIVLQ